MCRSEREGTLSPTCVFQNIHVSFLRTVPPYSHQADVWVELLKRFKYRQLVFIHSSDTDGRALLGRFQTRTQDLQTEDQGVKVQVITKASFFCLCLMDPPLHYYCYSSSHLLHETNTQKVNDTSDTNLICQSQRGL